MLIEDLKLLINDNNFRSKIKRYFQALERLLGKLEPLPSEEIEEAIDFLKAELANTPNNAHALFYQAFLSHLAGYDKDEIKNLYKQSMAIVRHEITYLFLQDINPLWFVGLEDITFSAAESTWPLLLRRNLSCIHPNDQVGIVRGVRIILNAVASKQNLTNITPQDINKIKEEMDYWQRRKSIFEGRALYHALIAEVVKDYSKQLRAYFKDQKPLNIFNSIVKDDLLTTEKKLAHLELLIQIHGYYFLEECDSPIELELIAQYFLNNMHKLDNQENFFIALFKTKGIPVKKEFADIAVCIADSIILNSSREKKAVYRLVQPFYRQASLLDPDKYFKFYAITLAEIADVSVIPTSAEEVDQLEINYKNKIDNYVNTPSAFSLNMKAYEILEKFVAKHSLYDISYLHKQVLFFGGKTIIVNGKETKVSHGVAYIINILKDDQKSDYEKCKDIVAVQANRKSRYSINLGFFKIKPFRSKKTIQCYDDEMLKNFLSECDAGKPCK